MMSSFPAMVIGLHGYKQLTRGTAETLRHCQNELEKVIPHLNSVSRLFEMPLNLINTDRFSANFFCEKAMQADNPHYIKSH